MRIDKDLFLKTADRLARGGHPTIQQEFPVSPVKRQ